MLSVVSTLEHIVKSSPFLIEGVGLGLFNLSEVARRLQPQIEATSWKPVGHAAVVMALRRLSARIAPPEPEPQLAVFLLEELTSRGDLTLAAYRVSPRSYECQRRLLASAAAHRTSFLSLSCGSDQLQILCGRSLLPLLATAFAGEQRTSLSGPLTAFTLHLDPHMVDAPGIYESVFRKLAFRKIAVVTFLCTLYEVAIVVAQSDADAAHDVLLALASG